MTGLERCYRDVTSYTEQAESAGEAASRPCNGGEDSVEKGAKLKLELVLLLRDGRRCSVCSRGCCVGMVAARASGCLRVLLEYYWSVIGVWSVILSVIRVLF
jgi:hypothetical protein